MSKKSIILLVIVAAVVVGGLMSVYTVDQTEQAIMLQLGKPVPGVKGPGLHFKMPFVQNIIRFEKRILTYDAAAAEVLTKDKKNLVVDNYAKWRIIDPLLFYKRVRNVRGAQGRLDDIIYSILREELARHDLVAVLSATRAVIMRRVTKKSDLRAREYGITIVDVRIKRADLPPQNAQAVYGRMRAERKRKANKYRAEGQEMAQRIRAEADRDKEIILANAYEKAQVLKGKGDAKAIEIYAKAYGRAMEFYRFLRTIEVYEKSLVQGTLLVMDSDNDILRYLLRMKPSAKKGAGKK